MATNPKTITVVMEKVLQPRMFNEAAMTGWLYTCLIDRQFVAPDLERVGLPSTKGAEPISLDTHLDHDAILEQLLRLDSAIELHSTLLPVANMRSPGTVHDSFLENDAFTAIKALIRGLF